MGAVYLAEDTRLRRRVALKFLPEELTRDPDRKQRFLQEAQAAAAIEHPNLAGIYEIDEVEERTFIVMEYVRGRDIRELLREAPLDVPRALHLALQVADALVKIHERGIVHRDLKPENVLVTDDDSVKIIDFGLAKLLEPLSVSSSETSGIETEVRLKTHEGHVLGTPAYMSPEQARGGPVDARTDVFAFGVLLYELLSGHPPFRRANPADTLGAILKEDPAPLRTGLRGIPARLDRLVRKALAKAPEDRYPTMGALAAELRSIEDGLRRSGLTVSRRTLVASLAATTAVVCALWWFSPGEDALPQPKEPLTLLVADFENLTGDPVFDGALEQALGLGLEAASFVAAYRRPEARRLAGEIAPQFREALTEEAARLVSSSEGIGLVIGGSIRTEGDGYELRARAVDPVTSEVLSELATRARDKADVLRAADELASRLRLDLGDVQPLSTSTLRGETFTTASLEAMSHYARAQELQYEGQYAEAILEYREAIEHDPELGRAYSGLGALLANMGERDEAQRQYDLALSRIGRMTEREKYRTRGGYYLMTTNYRAAIEEFEALVERYPADTAGYANLALAHFYGGDMMTAMEQGRRAVELYPTNVPQRNNLALYAMYAGDFESAAREARAVLELNPDFEKAHVVLAISQLARGDPEEAAKTYELLERVSVRGASLASIGLADIALYEGRVTDAVTKLREGVANDFATGNAGAAARKRATLAQALWTVGHAEAAVGEARRALADSEADSVLFLAARTFLRAGMTDEALDLAERLGARLQPHPRAYSHLIRGEVALEGGDYPGALDQFEEALGLADTWLGRLDLGRGYLAAGGYAEAHAELELCLERRGEAAAVFLDDTPTFSHFPDVYLFLAQAEEGLGDPNARALYERYLSMKPGAQGELVEKARARLVAR